MSEMLPKPELAFVGPEEERGAWTIQEKQRCIGLWDQMKGVMDARELTEVLTQAIRGMDPEITREEIERTEKELFAIVREASSTVTMSNRPPFERVEQILLQAIDISKREGKNNH